MQRRRRPAPRSASSATTRPTTSCTRSSAAIRSSRRRRPTSASPAPIIDFQAPLTHTLIADKKKKKGKFEKLFLDGRPPVNVGVTSGGDIFGGSAVTFSDVLGDQQFSLYAASISQYRTLSFSYLNLAQRFNYALQGFSQTQFFYGKLENVFYDPVYSQFIDRDLALATRTVRGGTVFGIWPFNRYRRVELFGGFMQYDEQFNDPSLAGAVAASTSRSSSDGSCSGAATTSRSASTSCRRRRCSASSARWPGNTDARSATSSRRSIGDTTLSRQTADVDARYYLRLGGTGLLALRARGFQSWGDCAGLHVLRRQLRDARLRVPGVPRRSRRLPQRRAALPAHRGDADAARRPGRHPRRALRQHGRRQLRRDHDPARQGSRSSGVATTPKSTRRSSATSRSTRFSRCRSSARRRPSSGLRLVDARASYGVGLETFALGFPVHFDWSWKTLLQQGLGGRAALRAFGGSEPTFRKPKFSVWIGYDF